MKNRKRIWLVLAIVAALTLAVGTTALAAAPGENIVKDGIRIIFVSTAVDQDGNPVETPKDGVLGELQGSGTIVATADGSTLTGEIQDGSGLVEITANTGAVDLDGNPVETPKDGPLGELEFSGTAVPSADGSEKSGTFD